MSVKFRCPCGKVYKVAEAHAGRKMVCQSCGKKLRIPGGEQPSAESAQPAPKSDSEFEFSDDLPDRSLAAAAPPPLVGAKRKKQPAPEAPKIKPDETSPGRKTAMIVGLALFGLLGIAGIGFVIMSAGGIGGSQEPAAPQQYTAFKSDDGGFQCEKPDGWEAKQGGGTGGVPPWARFEDGTATISIKASASGTAISDIAGASQFSGGVEEEIDDDLSPIARVHDFQKSKIELDYSDYEEKPGKNLKVPWGEVRQSEFTASEGFASKAQGYRVTLTGVQWQFNLICKCPPRQWEKYQPIFDHVISTLSH